MLLRITEKVLAGTLALVGAKMIGGAILNLWGLEGQTAIERALEVVASQPWNAWATTASSWWVITLIVMAWTLFALTLLVRALPEVRRTRRMSGWIAAANLPLAMLGGAAVLVALLVGAISGIIYLIAALPLRSVAWGRRVA